MLFLLFSCHRRPVPVALLACGLTLFKSAAAAQPTPVTLQEVVRRAVESSYSVIEADKRIAAARTALERSRAWLASNPQVTGGGSASNSEFERLTQDSSGGQISRRERFGPSYSFTLQQDLEIAGQRGARIEAAARGLDVAIADRRNREASVRAEAKKAFVEALESRAKVALAARATDLIRKVNAGFRRQDLDERQQINFNTSTMQLLRQQRREAVARRELADAYDRLKRVIALPLEQQIDVKGDLEGLRSPLPPLSQLRGGLEERRPDVAAYRSLLARADADLALARRSVIPDLSVFGFVSRFDGGGGTETAGGGSLGINLPIFQDNGPSVADAVTERQRAAAELEDLVRAVELDLTSAYRQCEDAAAELHVVTEQLLPRARENLELQRRRAARNEVSEYDVVDYELDLVTTETELVEAMTAYVGALIDLEKAAVMPLVGEASGSDAAPRSVQGQQTEAQQ